MPKEIRLWRVVEGRLHEVGDQRLDLERRLEDWVHDDIGVLEEDLLVIGRQVQTEFGGLIDLLALDRNGDLVIVELKRDRTPRDVTAQLLDYASWVADLSAERVTELAEQHLRSGTNLEEAFRRRFEEELPEVLNESHRMLVVGTRIDPASERIIRYLSEHHGLSINAVTFQYFLTPGGEELVGRVHLLEPEQVEQKARTKGGSKRRPGLSLDELESVAARNGVGDLYRKAFELFQPQFNYTQTTKSGLRLAAAFENRTGAVLNLLPTQAENGRLPYQLYTHRAAVLFERSVESIAASLPGDAKEWQYMPAADDWWRGHEGILASEADAMQLLRALKG